MAGARIEVWEADDDGLYDVQHGDDRTAARGHLFSGEDGSYRFWAITPTPYPIPHDGPVGKMLDGDGPLPDACGAPALHDPGAGYRTLVTHIFVQGDELLASDAVFGVKDSLVATSTVSPPGRRPRTDGSSTAPGPGRASTSSSPPSPEPVI